MRVLVIPTLSVIIPKVITFNFQESSIINRTLFSSEMFLSDLLSMTLPPEPPDLSSLEKLLTQYTTTTKKTNIQKSKPKKQAKPKPPARKDFKSSKNTIPTWRILLFLLMRVHLVNLQIYTFPMPQPQIFIPPPPLIAIPIPAAISLPQTTTTSTTTTSITEENVAIGVPIPMPIPIQIAVPAMPPPLFCQGKLRSKNCPPCPPCVCTPLCTPSFFSYCSPCHQKCRCKRGKMFPNLCHSTLLSHS
ncbi:uncharacterized protein LOC119191854 [Manduca sexta]|uniref:uncharacterized protein LOC119191854 n=1 Tax=Manduca sexta TaxID=7130 RepID=UPI00188E1233|nr:uncharacterized protein LOC119191854 [Manduca sexta]